ncbi:Endonuclease/exonuclease/phosphatase superfamily [Sesbania bispinosa]|nr:Endonuclease/exonuclease/phosphatase superfamily [Sesbania bispinosa]
MIIRKAGRSRYRAKEKAPKMQSRSKEPSPISVDLISSTFFSVHLRIKDGSKLPWILYAVYASPIESRRSELWDDITNFASSHPDIPWCVAGDFNTVLYDFEKEGGAPAKRSSIESFAACLNNSLLADIGFKGPEFTWSNGQHPPRNQNAPKGNFKFLSPWLDHPEFPDQVKSSWIASDSWTTNIDRFSDNISAWNKNVFGNIFIPCGRNMLKFWIMKKRIGFTCVVASGWLREIRSIVQRFFRQIVFQIHFFCASISGDSSFSSPYARGYPFSQLT